MKILFVYPSYNIGYMFGGAMKTITATLQRLAALKNDVKVLHPAGEGGTDFVEQIKNWRSNMVTGPCDTVREKGIDYFNASSGNQFCSQLQTLLDDFKPDWTIIGGETTGIPTRIALSKTRRVVWLPLNPGMLPFGPLSYYHPPEELAERLSLVKQLAGIMVHGNFMAQYASPAGIPVEGFNLPGYLPGPFGRFGKFDKGGIMIINPSDVKGLPIFLALAKRFPHLEFIAVPTWGTLENDLAQMKALPNVRLVDPNPDVGQVLKHARVLLVPSLWIEAFGMVSVDAMARGIPVMASDVGGLPHAKLGVEYILPVKPVVEYQKGKAAWQRGAGKNGLMRPTPVIPSQDIEPWCKALERLVGDREHYDDVAARSFEAGSRFVTESEDVSPIIRFLDRIGASL